MDMKQIFFALIVLTFIIGGACAASVNDFKVDDAYQNLYKSDYYSAYANGNQDCGFLIFKNVDDDAYDHKVNDDILNHVIHHDGREYITPDDDMKLAKNSDNTTNFTDYDHATKGVSEVIKAGSDQFIVVSWAKNSSSTDMSKLMSVLHDFNKNNKVEAIAF